MQSDASLSQTSQSQIPPEFEVELSDDEGSIGSIDSDNGLLPLQEPFDPRDLEDTADPTTKTLGDRGFIVDSDGEIIEFHFNPSPSQLQPTTDEDWNFDSEFLFNPSPPRWLYQENNQNEQD